jgi:hypothetical protein
MKHCELQSRSNIKVEVQEILIWKFIMTKGDRILEV